MGKMGEGKGADLFLEFVELVFFLLAVVVDFLLGFGAGVFDAFGAVWVVEISRFGGNRARFLVKRESVWA